MTNKVTVKCENGRPCKTLADRLQDSGKKGLCEARLINLKTGKYTRSIYFYKKTTSDKGMSLNFCPFCGFGFEYERQK